MRWQQAEQMGAQRLAKARAAAESLLSSGLEPRQLAFTLALGFAVGCIPLLGVTTGICALLALIFGLNMPAIQAANWAAMPLQAVLLIPYLKLGRWLIPSQVKGGETSLQTFLNPANMIAHAVAAPLHVMEQAGAVLGRALLAWGVTAVPALLGLTLLLTPLLRRIRRPAVLTQSGPI